MEAVRVVAWRKAFGATSIKQLQLLSINNIIECLRRRAPRNNKSVPLVRPHGEDIYTGIRNRLESQAYTTESGSAVADMAKAHLAALVAATNG